MKINSYLVDPEFPESSTETSDPYLPQELFDTVQETIPIASTDVVFVVRDEYGVVDEAICIARRSIYPMKGLWIIGGRMLGTDASIPHSIQRCVERETTLKLSLSRFGFLQPSLVGWARTRYTLRPMRYVTCVFRCVISREELAQASQSLSPDEYEKGFGLQPFTRERLVAEKCHPMLIDLYDAIFA